MPVKVTAIRKGNANPENPYLDIASFVWVNEQTQRNGVTIMNKMYDWIVNKGGRAYVVGKNNERIYLFGAINSSGERFVRSARDNVWTDDLIKLHKK